MPSNLKRDNAGENNKRWHLVEASVSQLFTSSGCTEMMKWSRVAENRRFLPFFFFFSYLFSLSRVLYGFSVNLYWYIFEVLAEFVLKQTSTQSACDPLYSSSRTGLTLLCTLLTKFKNWGSLETICSGSQSPSSKSRSHSSQWRWMSIWK